VQQVDELLPLLALQQLPAPRAQPAPPLAPLTDVDRAQFSKLQRLLYAAMDAHRFDAALRTAVALCGAVSAVVRDTIAHSSARAAADGRRVKRARVDARPSAATSTVIEQALAALTGEE
jgi:hypothetical protein